MTCAPARYPLARACWLNYLPPSPARWWFHRASRTAFTYLNVPFTQLACRTVLISETTDWAAAGMIRSWDSHGRARTRCWLIAIVRRAAWILCAGTTSRAQDERAERMRIG